MGLKSDLGWIIEVAKALNNHYRFFIFVTRIMGLRRYIGSINTQNDDMTVHVDGITKVTC